MPGFAVRVSTGVFSTLRYSSELQEVRRCPASAGWPRGCRRPGSRRARPDVVGLRIPREDELEAEDVAIEGDRAVEVGDLDAGVMRALDRWRPSGRSPSGPMGAGSDAGQRSSSRPSGSVTCPAPRSMPRSTSVPEAGQVGQRVHQPVADDRLDEAVVHRVDAGPRDAPFDRAPRCSRARPAPANGCAGTCAARPRCRARGSRSRRSRRSRVMPPFVVASTRLTSTASNASSACGWYEPPCSSPIATGVEMPSRISRDHLRVAGRHDVLEPADVAAPSSRLPNAIASAAVLWKKFASMPEPRVGERLAGGAQPRDRRVRGRRDGQLEAPPAGVPEPARSGRRSRPGRSTAGSPRCR